jgi:hypothetical protein
LAIDSSSGVYAYLEKPHLDKTQRYWTFDGIEDYDFLEVTGLISYAIGENYTDWRNSLICPENEEEVAKNV